MDKLKALLKKLGATAEDIEGVEAEIEADKEAEVEGLKRKNQELIRKSKESREGEGGKVAELEEKLQALTDERATMDKANKKAMEKLQADLKAAQDLVQAKSGKLTELLADGGLRKSLFEAGVRNSALLDGAVAMLGKIVQVDEEKGEAFVLAKDPKTGAETRKALAEYIKNDWAATDTAKSYLSAPASSGGGSGAPGNSGSGDKTMQRAQFNALSPASQMAYVKEGGKLTD